ncbi:metal-dependent hydrolase [Rhodococcus sp. D-46]|nr:metal-dependent hydrolase [Rhodococcus sp. D-46]
MVMGPTHAMSGAATGLAIAAVLPPEWGGPTSIPGAFIFAGITAGAALLPDLDSPQATIARSFGPLSQAVAHVVERISLAFHSLTSTKRDDNRENGHRTTTHTLGCQWPRSSPRRRPVVLPAGGHGFSPVAASCFSPPAF